MLKITQNTVTEPLSVIFLPFVIQSLGQRVLASPLAVAPNNEGRYFCLDDIF